MTSHAKIKNFNELRIIAKKLRRDGKKIVHCHGVFDLIHPGHIRYFQSAKKHGDILVVTITADRFVKKGPGRPIFAQDLRAEVLAALEAVDFVAIVEAESAIAAIKTIRPHVYVKGPDYKKRKPNPAIPRKLGEEEEAVAAFGGKLVFTDDIVFSSSHLINEFLDVYPEQTKAFLQHFKEKYSDEIIIDELCKLKASKVLVIGDAIIDQYVYTSPLGKSSKEPNVVHKHRFEESYAGGALATANHVAALSDDVTLITLLGKKQSFESFIRRHLRPQIQPRFFHQTDAMTVVKRRYIDEYSNQKLFHISYLKDQMIDDKTEQSVSTFLRHELPMFDVVIVNDFGHGFITKKLIAVIAKYAKLLAVNVQANSANFGFNVITKYPRADFVCIDDMELRLATHDRYGKLSDLLKTVYTKLSCREIIATRGPYGTLYYSKATGFVEVPALTQKIIDRIGAGDALFSITAPCVWARMNPELVSFIGNAASALKIATVGNKEPIDFRELTKFITRVLK